LSTFQALGGLGLLLGTLGLAAVLARNVLERRRELGLLQAVGFTPKHLRTLVLSESALLVGTGVILGTLTAIVAVLPALAERASVLPIGGLALLLLAVILTGVAASVVAARLAAATAVASALKGD
jgi:ABC-type antimicrobial peptide transport system permease subunit